MKTYHILVTWGLRVSHEVAKSWGLGGEDRMVWASWDHYPSIEATDELDAAERAIALSRLDHPEAHGFSASLGNTEIELSRLLLPGKISP